MKIKKKRLYLLFLFFILLYLFLSQGNLFNRYLYPFKYREEIIYYAESYQLDPFLVAAVIRAESGFNPKAISSKGAMGLMQLMPTTAEWAASMIGVDDFSQEKLLKPDYNIKIGCWYLHNLLNVFQGNRYIALAAYNAGRGEVRRWLIEGIWDGSLDNYKDIPFPETRSFVKKVDDYYHTYKSLYGARHQTYLLIAPVPFYSN